MPIGFALIAPLWHSMFVLFQVHPVALLQRVWLGNAAHGVEFATDVLFEVVLLGPPVPWHVCAAAFHVHPVALLQLVWFAYTVQLDVVLLGV